MMVPRVALIFGVVAACLVVSALYLATNSTALGSGYVPHPPPSSSQGPPYNLTSSPSTYPLSIEMNGSQEGPLVYYVTPGRNISLVMSITATQPITVNLSASQVIVGPDICTLSAQTPQCRNTPTSGIAVTLPGNELTATSSGLVVNAEIEIKSTVAPGIYPMQINVKELALPGGGTYSVDFQLVVRE